jgi:hypothetical protein
MTAFQIYCKTKFRRNPLSNSTREVGVLKFEHSRHQHNVLSVHNSCSYGVKMRPYSFCRNKQYLKTCDNFLLTT